MAARKVTNDVQTKPRRRPAKTPEARENQMIALAMDLAEQQLIDGSASSQVITHYIKAGSSRERLEQERLRLENEFTKAKSEALSDAKNMVELYGKALQAMKSYSGQPVELEIDFDD